MPNAPFGPREGDTPGQVAFAAFYSRITGGALMLPESWAMQTAETQAAWDAVGAAVLAQFRQKMADLTWPDDPVT